MTRCARTCLASAMAAGLASTTLSAQDVHVTIDKAAIDEIIRDVRQLVDRTVAPSADALGGEIRDAIRSAAGAGDSLGRLDAVLGQNRRLPAEQTDRATRTVAIGSSGTLDLDTAAGDITVTAGGGRDAVIDIIRVSRGETDADAKLGLEWVHADVEQGPDRVRVRAVYPNQRNTRVNVSVSYVITAPAGTRITAATVSGAVAVKGILGGVEATVTSGRIEVSGSHVSQARTVSGPVILTDVASDGTLDVRTVSGDVTLQGVKARRLTVDAVATGGIVAHGIAADSAALKTLSGAVEYSGPLARNGRYELSTFSGPVRFLPEGTVGFELEAGTFSGDIRPAPTMTFRDLSLSRRSLRGTFGDGAAVVVLKTFSGDVTIGK